MKRLLLTALATLTAALTFIGTLHADGILNYDFADVRYSWTHIDAAGVDDSNGLTVDLSYSPLEYFFLEGGYEYADTAFGGPAINLDADGHFFNYGGGVYYPLGETVHIKANVGGLYARVNTDAGDESEDGVYSGVGLRIRLGCLFELAPTVTYKYIESTTWDYTLDGLLVLGEHIALVTGVGLNDESDVNLNIGVRFSM